MRFFSLLACKDIDMDGLMRLSIFVDAMTLRSTYSDNDPAKLQFHQFSEFLPEVVQVQAI